MPRVGLQVLLLLPACGAPRAIGPTDSGECEACLDSGGTWQVGQCTSDCALQDVSCFRDRCPGPCARPSCECRGAAACEAAGCSWHVNGEAMWCSAGPPGPVRPVDGAVPAATHVDFGPAGARYTMQVPAGLVALVALPAAAAASPTAGGVGTLNGGGSPASSIIGDVDLHGFGAVRGQINEGELFERVDRDAQRRFGAVRPARWVGGGRRPAIVIELPAADQGLQGGRRYLVFDGGVDISLLCRWDWTEENLISRACDEVVDTLRLAE